MSWHKQYALNFIQQNSCKLFLVECMMHWPHFGKLLYRQVIEVAVVVILGST